MSPPNSSIRRLALVAVTFVLLATACSHPQPTAGLFSSTSATTAPKAASTGTPGTLGDLKDLCGDGGGKVPRSTARGVTDDEIQIGVVNDATNTVLPGLGQQYVDVAKAFASWCNEAGGINGRKLKIVSRDGQMTNQPANILDACESDFMLVGGSTPFDAQTVAPRKSCDLASIDLYPSADTIDSPLHATISRSVQDQVNVAGYRLLQGRYGDALQRLGVTQIDIASNVDDTDTIVGALEEAGYAKVVSYQKVPPVVDSQRTYIQPLVGKADAVYPAVLGPSIYWQGFKDVGYEPRVVIDAIGNFDTWSTSRAMADAPPAMPVYSTSDGYPYDRISDNPTLEAIQAMNPPVDGETRMDVSAERIWATWILFARAAGTCTDELTPKCVIDNAAKETSFDAGGIMAPVDVSDPRKMSACRTIVRVDEKGLHYEEGLTKPTEGPFNCDPKNVLPAG